MMNPSSKGECPSVRAPHHVADLLEEADGLMALMANGSNVDLCHRALIEAGQRIVMPGTLGAEIVDELKPTAGLRLQPDLLLEGNLQEIGPKEWICYKPRLSAFFQTPVEEPLKSLGISTIVICGTDFPASPRSTVYAAANRDFRLVHWTPASPWILTAAALY